MNSVCANAAFLLLRPNPPCSSGAGLTEQLLRQHSAPRALLSHLLPAITSVVTAAEGR